jgi:sarcosine oxidase, subunit gamma
MAQGNISPTSFNRRSYVYRILEAKNAEWAALRDAAVAMRLGRSVDEEVGIGRRLGLTDLSPLPRTGFKGTGTVEWLTAQGMTIGPDSNMAYRQADGSLAARLAPTEIFLIDSLKGEASLIDRLNGAWNWGSEKPRKLIGYPMPRSESHCWFMVSGWQAPAMFAKMCGVDLRAHKFKQGQIAQTSVAKISAILIRDYLGELPAYHLLTDSASAEYMWACVVDAMAEFDGQPIGLSALRRLAEAR